MQYTTTSDGYSIAFTVRGEGPSLVCLPFAFSQAQDVWTESTATPLLQALARRFRVVYFDSRGQGLSQRGLPQTTTVESFQADLTAILDRLHLERPILFGDNTSSHVAARFAAERPEEVAALVLMHCPVSFGEQVSWFNSLAGQNWDYFLSVQVGLATPGTPEEVRRLARRVERLKARTTREDYLQTLAAFGASDIADVLPRVVVPSLVLHPGGQQYVSQEAATRTASLLANGRLVVVGGSSFFGDPEQALAAIASLVSEELDSRPAAVANRAHPLSSREVEVLRLVAAGKSNQEIAGELVISLNTVNRHVSNIYAKTGAANRAQAAVFARDHALI